MDLKDFTVTKKAGLWVAGQRSPGAGKPIRLTEEQARYPLIAKEIEPGLPGGVVPEASPATEAPPAPVAKPRK